MSSLYVFHQSNPEQPYKVLTHAEDIASTLADHGVGFEQCRGANPVTPGASRADVVSAWQVRLDELMTQRGYASVDVISLDDAHPQKAELRAGYRAEHHYASDELRVFAAGRGLLTLRVGDYVYALLAERNDLVSIPAGIRQWFDIGENPNLVAIRLFKQGECPMATFTGDEVARQYPELDDM